MLRMLILVLCTTFSFGNATSILDSLEKRLEKLEKELSLCQTQEPWKRASNPTAPVVAFSAYLSGNVNPVAYNEAIVYDVVKLNTGDAYNAHVGRFQAPVNGIYHFVATAQSQSSDYIEFELVRDGTYLCRGRGSQSYQSTGTCAATVHLSAGSDVWVRHYTSHGNYIRGSAYSVFTGYLVHAD